MSRLPTISKHYYPKNDTQTPLISRYHQDKMGNKADAVAEYGMAYVVGGESKGHRVVVSAKGAAAP